METRKAVIYAEEQFAREIALGVIVKRPLKGWLYVIPGMFIVDFLRRGHEIRRFTQYYMFPRKLALGAVQDFSVEEDKVSDGSWIENKIIAMLNSIKATSADLGKSYMILVNILTKHYAGLLKVGNGSYPRLIKGAYQNRENYEVFLKQLVHAENEIYRLIIEDSGNSDGLKARISVEQTQLAKWRKKSIDDLFSTDAGTI